MTTRLYYTDAYRREFDARVVERAGDGLRVVLDRTAFYPTSGGQPHDLGSLAGIPVVDVIDEDDRITHVLAAPLPPLADGERVTGRIAWPRRFDHMQQHTGQHLLSAVFAELFGMRTESVHFGAETSTLDLDTASVSHEQLVAAEERANAIVFEDRPVAVSFEEAAAAEGLRKASARDGTLRIVTIEGVDRSACGGTHVRTTGEIGPVLLRKQERVRRSARIEFVCGMRAVGRARADYDVLSELARALTTSVDEVPAVIRARDEELRATHGVRRELEARLAGYRARELYDAAPADAAGVHRIVDRHTAGGIDELRALAQATVALPRAVFIGVVAEPPAIVFAASADTGVDAGAKLRQALQVVGGRGGGSPRVAQGTAPDMDGIERVAESL